MDVITRYIITFLAIIQLVGCKSNAEDYADDHHSKARNIILLIGDGMGEGHRKAARLAIEENNVKLAMDDMPIKGRLRTHSANSTVTDSAAASTAMASGVKTNNGLVGIAPNLTSVKTILEYAQQHGMAVGLVTTTQISHATPAAFASHVNHRKAKPEIARQLINKNIDVLLGGGENDFLPDTEKGCYPKNGNRTDGRNLIQEAVSADYTYLCDPAAFLAIKPDTTGKLLGLFADKGMKRPFSPTLAEMAQKAIDRLSHDPDGFFLLVEGGQIDWASHDNDAATTITTILGFDKAVKVAKDFASTNDNTLIIVTGDHETGGMKVSLTPTGFPGEDGPFITPDASKFYVSWETDKHTASSVPVTAQGPESERLAGTHDNTMVFKVMHEALNKSK